MIRIPSLAIGTLVLLIAAIPDPAWSSEEEASTAVAEQQPWMNLYGQLVERLEALEPRIELLESLDRPLNKDEKTELQKETETLRPMVEELRQRNDEVSEEILRQARDDTLPLYTRVVVLLEQAKDFAAPEEAKNAPQIESMISSIAFYGSLRGRAFWNDQGTVFDDSTSRIGLRGQLDVSRDYEFFGRLEVGTNLVSNVTKFLIGGDPGVQEGSENAPLPLRLAFVGFEGPQGRVSFGKQWSTYYDVGVFTDQAPFFGGVASGIFSAGTDGGISGTGRANQALQYRFAISHFKFGVQGQIRHKTENDESFADTWGISTIYQFNEGVTLGAAFNQVRDGIPNPGPEQPKLGDQALILGTRWQNENNYYAVTYTSFENHEKDDQGRFFDGYGVEVYADHAFGNGFGIGSTYNYQSPTSDLSGEYKIDFLSVGGSYFLGDNWRFYLIYKFDNSRMSDGSPLGRDTLAAAVFYNFSWGFAPF